MRILSEIRHPAQVHQLRNFITEMKKRGHIIQLLAVEKDVNIDLLRKYKIPFIKIGRNRQGLLKKFIDMIRFDLRVYKIAKSFKPDILLGMASPSLAHVSFLLRKPFISFCDSEPVKLIWLVTKPFMTKIVTPVSFRKNFGKKHVRYKGYKELAYLHPNYFKPDPLVLKEVGLTKDEPFFILRFVAFGASHDMGIKGYDIESKRKLISFLNKHGRVFISSEKPVEQEFASYNLKIDPIKMHSLLFFASMLVGDTQTMTTESAILGTPAIRCNSFVGPHDMGNFIELEKKYDLIYSFSDFDEAFMKVKELLKNKNLKKDWQKKRQKLLKDKIDVTKWMVQFIEELE